MKITWAGKDIAFKKTVDIFFANGQHHQVPRYFARTSYHESAGRDVLKQYWTEELRPYANPPWPLMHRVPKNAMEQKVRIMMIIPHWKTAPWYSNLQIICKNSITFADAVSLDNLGRLRSKQWWNTQAVIKDESLA